MFAGRSYGTSPLLIAGIDCAGQQFSGQLIREWRDVYMGFGRWQMQRKCEAVTSAYEHPGLSHVQLWWHSSILQRILCRNSGHGSIQFGDFIFVEFKSEARLDFGTSCETRFDWPDWTLELTVCLIVGECRCCVHRSGRMMSFWPLQPPEPWKCGLCSATRTSTQIQFTKTSRNKCAQSIDFTCNPFIELSSLSFPLSDSMLECHQFELLFAKSTDRINCVRKILANLWCWRLYRIVQRYFAVGRTLAGRRLSRSRSSHFMVGRGQGLFI